MWCYAERCSQLQGMVEEGIYEPKIWKQLLSSSQQQPVEELHKAKGRLQLNLVGWGVPNCKCKHM